MCESWATGRRRAQCVRSHCCTNAGRIHSVLWMREWVELHASVPCQVTFRIQHVVSIILCGKADSTLIFRGASSLSSAQKYVSWESDSFWIRSVGFLLCFFSTGDRNKLQSERYWLALRHPRHFLFLFHSHFFLPLTCHLTSMWFLLLCRIKKKIHIANGRIGSEGAEKKRRLLTTVSEWFRIQWSVW